MKWEAPISDATLLGYKYNIGSTGSPPDKIALFSTNDQGIALDFGKFNEYGEHLVFLVWGYSANVDGEVLRVILSPSGIVGKYTICV